MQSIQDNLNNYLQERPNPQAQSAAHLRYAWEQVAPEAVLAFTGSVIYDKKDPNTIVIYTTSALHKAELDLEKELYRIQLSSILRPPPLSPIDEIRFVVSRWTSKQKALQKTSLIVTPSKVEPLALSAQEERHAREITALVRDPELKQSLYKAMKAQIEWKKGREASKTP